MWWCGVIGLIRFPLDPDLTDDHLLRDLRKRELSLLAYVSVFSIGAFLLTMMLLFLLGPTFLFGLRSHFDAAVPDRLWTEGVCAGTFMHIRVFFFTLCV